MNDLVFVRKMADTNCPSLSNGKTKKKLRMNNLSEDASCQMVIKVKYYSQSLALLHLTDT